MNHDDTHRALADRVDAATPPSLPSYDAVLTRRDRRRARRRAVVAGSLAVAVAAAGTAVLLRDRGTDTPTALALDPSTGASPTGTAASAGPSPHTPAPDVLESVPTLVVEDGDRSTTTFTGSTCWMVPQDDGTGYVTCTDMLYPDDDELPDVGSPVTLELTSPLAGTTYRARFSPLEAGCARAFTIRASDLGDDRFRLAPSGPAGRYRVTLEGDSPQGTIPAAFVWTIAGAAAAGSCS